MIFRQTPRYETPVDRLGARARWAWSRVSISVLERRVRASRSCRERAPILTAEHLSKWYGQVIGLNDVTVSVPPGITGLLGPNGAGKSTFMKLITGQLRPSKGAVTVLGEPIWGNPKLYFRIGFCPEQDAFYDRMTGLEWVTALVRLNGLDEAAAKAAAERALDAVDLMDAANKRIGAYSKGMRQRVKLAQALVHDPELLILDEPLSGMDPIGRRKTMRMIRDWAKQGKSILVSSHILHEIESMTSNILLINNGRILAEGNVHQIRDLIDDASAHRLHPRRRSARPGARVPGARRRHQPALRARRRRRRDRQARRVLRAASPSSSRAGACGAVEEVTSPDDNLQAVFKYLVKSMTMATRHAVRSPGFLYAALRVFDLSLGEMLWSRRTVFMALVVGLPVLIAVVVRSLVELGRADHAVNSTASTGPVIFGLMIWGFFVRFSVPVLGVFYGTSLIADEVEDKTITYLFTRPIPRGAVLRRQVPGLPGLHGLRRPARRSCSSGCSSFRIGGSLGGELPRPGQGPGPAGARPGRLRGGVRARSAPRSSGPLLVGPDLRVRLGDAGRWSCRATSSASRWPTTCRGSCRTRCRATRR